MSVRREVEIEASPEEVWDALATEEGRERWLEEDPERELHVEVADEPSRLVWWWWRGDEPATRVELLVVAAPVGPVFAALADPTRRWIVETLTREGRTSVPALTGALPITRQAVAKHLA